MFVSYYVAGCIDFIYQFSLLCFDLVNVYVSVLFTAVPLSCRFGDTEILSFNCQCSHFSADVPSQQTFTGTLCSQFFIILCRWFSFYISVLHFNIAIVFCIWLNLLTYFVLLSWFLFNIFFKLYHRTAAPLWTVQVYIYSSIDC